MKKIVRMFLGIFLVVGVLAIGFNFNVRADESVEEEEHEKGELRCPLELTDNGVKCEEIVEDGQVVEADITYTEKTSTGEIEVKKMVKKDFDKVGRYTVQFLVKGNVEKEINVPKPAYIVVIIDMSSTMGESNYKNKAIKAVKRFASTLIPNGTSDYYHLALVTFEDSAKVNRKLSNKTFSNGNFPKYDDDKHQSYINKAYGKANSILNSGSVPEYANKYVLLLGDGNYWTDDSLKEKAAGSFANYITTFKNLGIKTFGIMYSDGSKDSPVGCGADSTFTNVCTACNNKKRVTNYACNKSVFTNLTDNNYLDLVAHPKASWQDYLEDVAKEIIQETNNSSFAANVTDDLGSDFYLENDSLRYKTFDVESLTEEGVLFPEKPFIIDIDPTTNTGWHKTNEDFTLTYNDGNGKKDVTINDNPEVYWKGNSLNINSCSGEANYDTDEFDRTEGYKYYSKSCSEGYSVSKKEYADGYKVRINIDNAKDGQKSFDLVGGRGFPASVSLSTNIKCTYKFNVDDYNKDYNSIQESISNYDAQLNNPDIPADQAAIDALNEANKDDPNYVAPSITKEIIEKDRAYLIKELASMQQALETYKTLVNIDELNDYRDKFNEQPATVRVNYKDGTYDSLDLVNITEADEQVKVSSKKEVKVNGSTDTISPETTATLHLEKEMGLIETCLDMSDSEQVDCSVNSNLISGGNKFYVDLEETEGSVSVLVLSAGYRGNYNFRLDKDELGNPACSYTNSVEKLDFRQIELNDPFLKEIDSNRGVGKNYLNNTFDFEKIIHGDTWNSKYEPEYYYLMSKTNIANIKKDTKEDYSNSYLGRSCYFTDNNQWRCHFTRNESDDSSNKGDYWFYETGIN